MEKKIKENRYIEIRAIEDTEDMIIEGYAAVFNQETDLGWCKEVIDSKAFNECDMKDCCLNYNHGQSKVVARTRCKNKKRSIRTISRYNWTKN